jgi:hypothetical protein
LQKDWSARVTVTDVRQLAGCLLDASKVCNQTCPFLSRIIDVIRLPNSVKGSDVVNFDSDTLKDVAFWRSSLSDFNGIRLIRHTSLEISDSHLSMDATSTGGGAFYGILNPLSHLDNTHKATIASGLYMSFVFPNFICTASKGDINCTEMLMVLICLRKWGVYMGNGCHQFYIDNMSTVDSLYSGRSTNSFRQSLLREITALTTRLDVSLRPSHLPGVENRLADHLSCMPHDQSKFALFKREAAAAGFPSPIFCPVAVDDFRLDPSL